SGAGGDGTGGPRLRGAGRRRIGAPTGCRTVARAPRGRAACASADGAGLSSRHSPMGSGPLVLSVADAGPAAHVQRLPRDEVGAVGGEEDHRPRHFLRAAQALQRHLAGVFHTSSTPSVSVGATALTVIPYLAHSAPRLWVRVVTPALAAA